MDPESVLSFWFEECRPWQWFCRREDFDAVVRRRFLEATEAALKGDLRHVDQRVTPPLYPIPITGVIRLKTPGGPLL